MGIAFGLFIVAIIILGLIARRRQNKAWVQEERYDESGAWVDKRSGERGTYGSLDAEMELERSQMTRQGQVNDLARLIRDHAFEHFPGFHEMSDAQIKSYSAFTKQQAAQLIDAIGQFTGSRISDPAKQSPVETPYSQALKKKILDFSYRHFPALLDLEIETIKQFDRHVSVLSNALENKIAEVKG